MSNKKNWVSNKVYYLNNAIINSRKPFGMTEHRIFRLALTDLKPQFKNMKSNYNADQDFRPFFISTMELMNLFKATGSKANYERVKQAANNLMNTHIEIGTADHFTLFPLFDFISYDATKGLKLKFHDRLKPLLLDLNNNAYTKSFLKLSFSLTRPRSLTLLEMLLEDRYKAKNGIIIKEFTVEELKFAFNISPEKYKGRMNNFRTHTLDPAINEIDEKTNYYIRPDYEVKYGKGNKIESFVFTFILPKNEDDILTFEENIIENEPKNITENIIENVTENIIENKAETVQKTEPKIKQEKPEYTEEEIEKIIELQAYGLKRKMAETKLKEYGIEGINKAIENLKSTIKPVTNPAGYIISFLKFLPTLEEQETEEIYKKQGYKTEREKAQEKYNEILENIKRQEAEEIRKKNEEARKNVDTKKLQSKRETVKALLGIK